MSIQTLLNESIKKSLVKLSPEYASNINRMKFLGKRTTLLEENIAKIFSTEKRTSIFDSFKQFNLKIIPEMEKTIELNLLKNKFEKIENPIIKKSILHAYHKRNLDKLVYKSEVHDYFSPQEVISLKPTPIINYYTSPDILSHNENDIGFYIKFSIEDLDKYFNKGFYGNYLSIEYKYTKEFSLLCTEEALRIVNELKKISSVGTEKFDLSLYFNEKNTQEEIEIILDDEKIYPKIFQKLAVVFRDELYKYRNDLFFQKLFHTSSIFDMIIHIMISELKYAKLIPEFKEKLKAREIFRQIAVLIEQNADRSHANALDLKHFIKSIKKFDLNLSNNEKYTVNLLKYEKYPKFLPDYVFKYGIPNYYGYNSGVFVHGGKGSGKSGILGYVTMWAHKDNWVVISVPNVYKWTQDPKEEVVRHHKTGLYLQPNLTSEFLEHLKSANFELFSRIKVNLNIYGKFNASGKHDDEPEPVPNTYDEHRKVHFNDHLQFYHPDEWEEIEEEEKLIGKKLGELLPKPTYLLDIIEYGIKNKLYSTNALYEILEQLYDNEEYKTVVLVDDYNWLFRPSIYPSFRYANDKNNKSHIPPSHLSLCRAFINFDGHKIKNGFKIVASGIQYLYKHKFNPDQIYFPKGYCYEAKGLLLDDYRRVLDYYKEKKLWRPTEIESLSYEQYWMETQGNWIETIKTMINHGREY